MSHVEHRTWFPFILVGLTFALLLAVGAWVQHEGGEVEVSLEAPSDPEYMAELTTVLTTYDTDDDVQAAYDELLDMRVPAGYKELHLELVIAFGKLLGGDEEGASRLETVRSMYSWLP